MRRPPPAPERTSFSNDDIVSYDAVAARLESLTDEYRRVAGPYHQALLNSPQLAAALGNVGRVVRQGSIRETYSDAERELADVVLSHDLHFNGVLPIHLPDAIAVGVRFEAIDAIRHEHEADLNESELQLVRFIRAVAFGTTDDDLFDEMSQRFGLSGAIDYAGFVAFLLCTIRMWQVVGMPSPSEEEIDALLDDLRSGAMPLPSPHAHLA